MRKLFFILMGVLIFSYPVKAANPAATATDAPKQEKTEEARPEEHPEDPDTHEIYNSGDNVYLIQGTGPIDNVIEAINRLTDQSTDDDVRSVRLMYNSLNMAQKARVNNESKLYEMEKKRNITYDYEKIYTEKNDSYVISGDSSKGTTYTFELCDTTKSLSITIQYTVDIDMDGVKDTPDIALKKPDGTNIMIAPDTSEIRDATMNIKMTWTSSFMQLDIANGDYGKWMITSDEPVIFTSMPYAGFKQEIEAVPEVIVETTEEEETEDTVSNSSLFIRLGILVAIIVAAVLFLNHDKKKRVRKPKRKQDIEKVINRSEEEIEKTREDLRKIIKLDTYDYEPEHSAEKMKVDTQDNDIESYKEQPDSYIWNGESGESDFLDDFR